MKSSVLLGTDQRTLTFGVAALLSLFSPTSTEFAYSFVVAVLLCTLLLFGIEVHKSNFGRAITIFLMALSPFFELAYMGYLAKLVFAIYFVFLIIILLKLRDSTVSANSPFLLVCGVGLATSWNPQPFIAVCAALVISILFITTLNGIKLLVHKTVSSIRIALSLIENLLASTFLIIIIGVLSWGVTRNLNLNTRFSPAMTKEESWNYDFVERFTTLFGANWYGDPKFLPTKFLIPSFICCTFAFLGFLFLNFSLPKEVTTEKTLAIFYSSVLMLILATSLFNELVRVSIQLSGFPWLIFAVLSPTLIPRKKSTGEFSYEKRIISVLVVTSLIGASMPKLVIIAIPFYQFDDVAIYRYSQQNIKKINKCTNGHDLLIGSTFGPAEAEFLNLAFSHFGQRVELSQTAVEAIRNWYRDQSNRSSYFPGDLAQNSKFVLERENVANDVVVCRYGSLSVYYRT
jgi:hypothetical protein